MRLTLEHLAPRLPYGLKLHTKFEEIGTLNGLYNVVEKPVSMFDVVKSASSKLEDVKPILRPLSDLTKLIEHRGEKFIPIDDLGNITTLDYEDGVLRQAEVDGEMYETEIKYLCYAQVQDLYKWHFDTDNLIEQGLAIDVNTLDKNPYA